MHNVPASVKRSSPGNMSFVADNEAPELAKVSDDLIPKAADTGFGFHQVPLLFTRTLKQVAVKLSLFMARIEYNKLLNEFSKTNKISMNRRERYERYTQFARFNNGEQSLLRMISAERTPWLTGMSLKEKVSLLERASHNAFPSDVFSIVGKALKTDVVDTFRAQKENHAQLTLGGMEALLESGKSVLLMEPALASDISDLEKVISNRKTADHVM